LTALRASQANQAGNGRYLCGYDAKIDNLSRYAAVWDSYHDLATCCGTFNTGYHKTGYNVLFYDGAVVFMDGSKFPYFPYNLAYDSTDCWGPWSNIPFWTWADASR
jgi:prepilin-type processing-associated H-X9-DG protein